MARLLLGGGAEPNRYEHFGDTPLLVATKRSDKDMVELLLGAGAGPNLHGCCGDTPLFWAATRGWLDVVQLLLDAGADPRLAHKDIVYKDLVELLIDRAVQQDQLRCDHLVWYTDPYLYTDGT